MILIAPEKRCIEKSILFSILGICLKFQFSIQFQELGLEVNSITIQYRNGPQLCLLHIFRASA